MSGVTRLSFVLVVDSRGYPTGCVKAILVIRPEDVAFSVADTTVTLRWLHLREKLVSMRQIAQESRKDLNHFQKGVNTERVS